MRVARVASRVRELHGVQGARPRVGGAHERRALEACGLVVGLRASGRRQGDAELGEAALDVHGPHECRAARTDRGQQRGGERPRGQERSGAAQHFRAVGRKV